MLISITIQTQNGLDVVLKKFNQQSVPYITVDSLKKVCNDVIVLDAREHKEYNVSHIQNAVYVGYDNFDLKKTVKQLPKSKNTKIVVYCSLGVRSEDIGEQLQKVGFTNVTNLYGGIFEWKNQGNKVYNSKNNPTEKVHAFDKEWGVWLKKGIKIYE